MTNPSDSNQHRSATRQWSGSGQQTNRKWARRYWIARRIMLAIAACIIVGGVSGTLLTGEPFPLLIMALLLLACVPWYVRFRSESFDLFDPMIFKSVFIAMLAASVTDRLYGEPRELQIDGIGYTFDEAFLSVGLLFCFYFAFMLIGYYAIRDYSITLPSWVRIRGRKTTETLRRASFAYMGLGLVFYTILLLTVTGGNPFLLYTTTEPRSELFEGAGILMLGANMLYIGYFIWLLSTLSESRFPSLAQFATLPLIIGLMSLLGGRGLVMRIAVVVAIIGYYSAMRGFVSFDMPLMQWTARRHPLTHALLLPALWLGGAAFLVATRAARLSQPPLEALRETDFLSVASAGVHDTLVDNMAALMTFVPSDVSYAYGAFYGRVILNYIPRAIWPGKPVATEGGVIRRWFVPDGTGGLPPGEMGSFYMNFGVPGIFIGAFLYGVFFKIVYNTLYENRNSLAMLLVFALLLAHITPYGIVNNALLALTEDLVLLSPVLVYLWRSKK